MLAYDQFEILTFDCYGTLIDWETGILEALMPVLEEHDVATTGDQLLEVYAAAEAELEAGNYRPYGTILRQVVGKVATRFGFTPSAAELDCLVDSIGGWPPFEDTIESLERLKSRYKLGIISNVDDDLFTGTNQTLRVEFDHIVTAAQAQAYKPAHGVFDQAVKTIGLPKERILHVAQSLFHDHVPAQELGFKTVWINRRAGKEGTGATPQAAVKPDAEFPDLKSLVAATGL